MADWWIELNNNAPSWMATGLPFQAFSHSFVSGSNERDRIQIAYFQNAQGQLGAKVHFGKRAEGPPGHAHGGAQAAVLDEVCGGVPWLAGLAVVAGKLSVSFKSMCPLGVDIYVKAWITKREGRKTMTEGEIRLLNGTLVSSAEVLFIELDEAQKEGLLPAAKWGGK